MKDIWITLLFIIGLSIVSGCLISIGVFFHRVWIYINTPQQSAHITIGKDANGMTMTINGGNVTFTQEAPHA